METRTSRTRAPAWPALLALIAACGFAAGQPPAGPTQASLQAIAQLARAQHIKGVDAAKRLATASPIAASIFELGRGAQSSVNAWQMNEGLPDHIHQSHEEVIIVMSGHASARVGDKTVELAPGDVLIIPPGVPHGAHAVGRETFRGYSVFSPAFDGKDRVFIPGAS